MDSVFETTESYNMMAGDSIVRARMKDHSALEPVVALLRGQIKLQRL